MSSSLTDATLASSRTPDAADIMAADSRHVIHGFSPFGDRTPGPVFASGRGITLTDVDGQDWIDACAGQANVSLGYGRTDLADVVADALRELTFGTHFYQRRSHVGAARLAERLAEVTPAGLDQFVFMLGGSDAVDTAIKIARFANIAAGRPRRSTSSAGGTATTASPMAGRASPEIRPCGAISAPAWKGSPTSISRRPTPWAPARCWRTRFCASVRTRSPRVHGRADLDSERYRRAAGRLLASDPRDL
ncbi:aspartate aminotransferase family protein [Mycolicibacterium vaccae]|nr:aspartate aminotransferase family protein [Mycolicibacterium vaccae]